MNLQYPLVLYYHGCILIMGDVIKSQYITMYKTAHTEIDINILNINVPYANMLVLNTRKLHNCIAHNLYSYACIDLI